MVGGGNQKDEGSVMITSTNVFAALDSRSRKKTSDKDRGSKGSSKAPGKEPAAPVFWAPAPLTAKSWADVDDEDDDDYYATTAPLQSVWGSNEMEQTKEKSAPVEESESEEDLLDEGDDDIEDDHDNEPDTQVQSDLVVKKPLEISSASKETGRQLSKKERKKKELAELEALLADFGVSQKESGSQDRSYDVEKEKKEEQPNGESASVDSKSAKKKKKKDKPSKETNELHEHPNSSDVTNGTEGSAGVTEQVEEDGSAVDMKERLKKMASMKKKKSSKEMDAAARVAATEAAARNARVAAVKKKEKSHYNQQPGR